jgi:ABC-type proline/glycine betaine transport system permease subunit
MMASGSGIAGVGTTATHVQVGTPSQVVQSVVNSGMTSVVSSLGGGGVANHITNSANNQLVQQVITANIGITGLGQAIQQGVASTVMSRVQAANAQFR